MRCNPSSASRCFGTFPPEGKAFKERRGRRSLQSLTSHRSHSTRGAEKRYLVRDGAIDDLRQRSLRCATRRTSIVTAQRNSWSVGKSVCQVAHGLQNVLPFSAYFTLSVTARAYHFVLSGRRFASCGRLIIAPTILVVCAAQIQKGSR